MGCNNILRLGTGIFYPVNKPHPLVPGASVHYGVWDGHKYVCGDDFKEEQDCLVYTFGVGTDISFEEAMATKGTDCLFYL